jgi:cytochrome c oxidase subunit 3
VPLLNTIILVASGVRVTWAHKSIEENNHRQSLKSLYITIVLGLYFTVLQAIEYYEATFRFSDSAYGSTFFIATGFHGLHVIVGTLFLIVCCIRISKGGLGLHHHFGFVAAVWY